MTFQRAFFPGPPRAPRRRLTAWPQFVFATVVLGGATSQIIQVAACGGAAAAAPDGGTEGGADDSANIISGDLGELVDSGGFDAPDAYLIIADTGVDVPVPPDAGCSFMSCPGQCVAERCVFVLKSSGNYGGGTSIAVSNGTVFWSVSGTTPGAGDVYGIAANGANYAVWGAGQDNPTGLAVSGSSLYWADESPTAGTIVEATPGTGLLRDAGPDADASSGPVIKLSNIASSQASPSAVAVDDTNVYWTVMGPPSATAGTGFVLSAPLGGGEVVTLASALYAPISIAVDSTYAYWAENGTTSSSGLIRRIPKAGASHPTILASQLNYPSSIAVSGTHVYWAELASQNSTSAVMGISTDGPDGGVPPVVIQGGLVLVGGIAADSTNVYWTTPGLFVDGGADQNNGLVMTVPIEGNVVTTLTTGLNHPGAIAVDDTSLYWVDSILGSVTSLTPK